MEKPFWRLLLAKSITNTCGNVLFLLKLQVSNLQVKQYNTNSIKTTNKTTNKMELLRYRYS